MEFNPDLALRNISEFKAGKRKKEECISESLKEGKIFNFLKREQRIYWLHGEVSLLETKGNQELSLPIASIIILEATHILVDREVWTKGKYKVVKIIKDGESHFNGFAKV